MEDSDVRPEFWEDGVVDGVGGDEVQTALELSASGSIWVMEGEKFGGVGADASRNTLLLEDESADEGGEVSCTTSVTSESAWLASDASSDSETPPATPPPSAVL